MRRLTGSFICSLPLFLSCCAPIINCLAGFQLAFQPWQFGCEVQMMNLYIMGDKCQSVASHLAYLINH